MTKQILFCLLIISILYSSTLVSASETLSTNHLISENSQDEQMYGYYKNYTLSQWRALSQSERNKEIQIPEHIFKSLDTKELIIQCLSNPSVTSFANFSDPSRPSAGFNNFRVSLMAFDHLIQRADLAEAITELYTSQESPLINLQSDKISEEQRSSVNVFIGHLINVPEIIQLFSNDQINAISLQSTIDDYNEDDKSSILYRIAMRNDTIFRIDKIYARVANVYNVDINIPERYTNYLLAIEELEAIKKIEILKTKEEQKTQATRAYYSTRWGQSSMLIFPTTTFAPLTPQEIAHYNSSNAYYFPNAVRLSEPTNKFNCHSYSLFSYDGICEFYVTGNTAAAILNTNDNNYFSKTYFASTNFPLNYTLVRWGDGTFTNHTGVLYSIFLSGTPGRPNFIGVKSKWGDAGIYYHDIYDCEYLGAISYYYKN